MKKQKNKKEEPPQSVKGMRDIIGDTYYQYEGFFEKASEVAMYYGFQPIETPLMEHERLFTSGIGESTDVVEKEMYNVKTRGAGKIVLRPEGTAPIMRAYLERGMQSWPQPVMLYYKGPFFRHENPQHGRYREFFQFGIEMIGTTKSIADATIVHVISTILQEAGIKEFCIDINSIGDEECRPKYVRELVQYYRKNLAKICVDCKRRIKENPLRLLDCKDPKCAVIKTEAPKSVAHLCDVCKKHFKEVLEYLESMDLPYRINNNLVRGFDYYSRTVFEIVEYWTDDKEPDKENADNDEAPATIEPQKESGHSGLALAGGGRYDYLAKAIGSRRDIGAIGASIGVDRIFLSKQYTPQRPRILKKPKIYFIQLGTDARQKSLPVIEALRVSKIPIMQTLTKDSLTAQLGLAEKLKISHSIIFGQKEALDENVIVRNMSNRSQETVKIEDLVKYLKKLK